MNNQDIHIISFCGGKHKGKDTATTLTLSLLHEVGILSKRFSIGDKIKLEVAKAFGVSTNEIESNKEFWRPILQTWANEFRRTYQHNENYWTTVIKSDIHSFFEEYPSSIGIISDMRRMNDLEEIRGWYETRAVFVKRTTDANAHISESEIQEKDCEYTLTNNGSIDELNAQIKDMLIGMKIIV